MNIKTLQRRNGILLTAAIAALSGLALSRPALGQFPAQNQQEQPGHANDSNNRVGGNGINSARPINNSANNNFLVNRASILAPPNNNSGVAPGIAPSAGQPIVNRSTLLQQSTAAQDSNISGLSSNIASQNLSAPMSQTLNASALYGLHTTYLNGTENPTMPMQFDSLGVQEQTILQMREELQGTSQLNNPTLVAGRLQQPGIQNNQLNSQQQPSGLNQPLNQSLSQPFDAPADAAMVNSLRSSQIANAPLSSTGIVATGRDKSSLLLPPANEQSPLIKTLQDRLASSSSVGKALADVQASKKAAQPGRVATTPQIKGGADQGPVQVSSLAVGIKAKGLHDLLAGAEELVRQGKYDSAITKFGQAQRVAPNNPLAVVGRGQAELAGGYYARAEQDLRVVFRTNPEMLKAQFDLKGLFPQDRVDFIRKDLHDLAQNDVKSERPWFLLAYLDYNSSNPASASQDLDEVEKRAPRGDWAVRLMRQHWMLVDMPKAKAPAPQAPAVPSPAQPATPELNK